MIQAFEFQEQVAKLDEAEVSAEQRAKLWGIAERLDEEANPVIQLVRLK